MKSIAFLINDEFHKDFKIHCAIKGVDMKNRIIELMKKDIEETQKEIKK